MIVKISVIVCLIAVVRSKTVWLDITTGKVVSVSKDQTQQNLPDVTVYQLTEDGNKPTGGIPWWNCRNSDTEFIIPIPLDEMLKRFSNVIQRAGDRTPKRRHARRSVVGSNVDSTNDETLNPKWICVHNGTGDMMIIASDVMADKFQIDPNSTDPGQTYPWSKTTKRPARAKKPFPIPDPNVSLDPMETIMNQPHQAVDGRETIQSQLPDSEEKTISQTLEMIQKIVNEFNHP